MSGVLLADKLQQHLIAHWADILDRNLLIKQVLEDSRDTEYPKLHSSVEKKMAFSVTKFEVANGLAFEVWIEFSAPKENGIVIGTHVYELKLDGELNLLKSYGTHFLPEIQTASTM